MFFVNVVVKGLVTVVSLPAIYLVKEKNSAELARQPNASEHVE
jgi:hypothetical protein